MHKTQMTPFSCLIIELLLSTNTQQGEYLVYVNSPELQTQMSISDYHFFGACVSVCELFTFLSSSLQLLCQF